MTPSVDIAAGTPPLGAAARACAPALGERALGGSALGGGAAVLAALVVTLVAGALGCGLEAGERFGRPGADPDVLRIHVLDDVDELDPARARTPLERAVSRQLFAALVELDDAGRPQLSLATAWFLDEGRLTLELREGARFSDGSPLDAHDVVWSWRRALRPSTGTADRRPFSVIARGDRLMRYELLRVGATGARARPPPFATFADDGAAASPPASSPASSPAGSAAAGAGAGDEGAGGMRAAEGAFLELPPGAPVRVLDTNARVPCCGSAVPLARAPRPEAASSGALLPGDVGVIIAMREVPGAGRRERARLMLQLRGPDGSAGWCDSDAVKASVPTVGLAGVVDRGTAASTAAAAADGAADGADGDDAGPVLRAGPDEAAPVRARLVDEDVVEVLERGAEFSLVIDPKSGKSGFIASGSLEDTAGERRWLLVELDDGRRGWVAEQELAFDPSLLDVAAVDGRTLVVGLAPGVDVERALAAFSEPVMRPVPARAVEERGHAWLTPAAGAALAPTSGPFALGTRGPDGLTLLREASSFEAHRARVERVDLERIASRTTALHLYRAGRIDVVLDGALPPHLAPTLARASDFVAGAAGGALVAPEVRGLRAGTLELRDVSVEVRP